MFKISELQCIVCSQLNKSFMADLVRLTVVVSTLKYRDLEEVYYHSILDAKRFYRPFKQIFLSPRVLQVILESHNGSKFSTQKININYRKFQLDDE